MGLLCDFVDRRNLAFVHNLEMLTGFAGCFLLRARSKVTVTAGKDARSDPEFLLEKLGGFDFASAAGEGAGGGKGLEALSQLKQTLAKVFLEHLSFLMSSYSSLLSLSWLCGGVCRVFGVMRMYSLLFFCH